MTHETAAVLVPVVRTTLTFSSVANEFRIVTPELPLDKPSIDTYMAEIVKSDIFGVPRLETASLETPEPDVVSVAVPLLMMVPRSQIEYVPERADELAAVMVVAVFEMIG